MLVQLKRLVTNPSRHSAKTSGLDKEKQFHFLWGELFTYDNLIFALFFFFFSASTEPAAAKSGNAAVMTTVIIMAIVAIAALVTVVLIRRASVRLRAKTLTLNEVKLKMPLSYETEKPVLTPSTEVVEIAEIAVPADDATADPEGNWLLYIHVVFCQKSGFWKRVWDREIHPGVLCDGFSLSFWSLRTHKLKYCLNESSIPSVEDRRLVVLLPGAVWSPVEREVKIEGDRGGRERERKRGGRKGERERGGGGREKEKQKER